MTLDPAVVERLRADVADIRYKTSPEQARNWSRSVFRWLEDLRKWRSYNQLADDIELLLEAVEKRS